MTLPLVSCLMLTRDRPHFVTEAIHCWQAQTYSSRELIILDNGARPIRHLLPGDPRIHYHTAPYGVYVMGELFNLAARLAHGELLAGWDDDDWHHPDRICLQYQLLLAHPDRICLLGPRVRCETWPLHEWYLEDNGPAGYADGPFLARREIWQDLPPFAVGEKNPWIADRGYVTLDRPELYIRRVHHANTWCTRAHLENRSRCTPVEFPPRPGFRGEPGPADLSGLTEYEGHGQTITAPPPAAPPPLVGCVTPAPDPPYRSG